MSNLPFGNSSSSCAAPRDTRNVLPKTGATGPNPETIPAGGSRLIATPPTPRGATNTPFKLNGGG